jgi:hypothetical protein
MREVRLQARRGRQAKADAPLTYSGTGAEKEQGEEDGVVPEGHDLELASYDPVRGEIGAGHREYRVRLDGLVQAACFIP